MSRISVLENKVDALERNGGVIAKTTGVEDWVKVGDYSSISHYKDGINDAPEEDEEKKQECIEELVDEVNRCYDIIDRLMEYIDVLKNVNKPFIFVSPDDKDNIEKIKKFLNENALGI